MKDSWLYILIGTRQARWTFFNYFNVHYIIIIIVYNILYILLPGIFLTLNDMINYIRLCLFLT